MILAFMLNRCSGNWGPARVWFYSAFWVALMILPVVFKLSKIRKRIGAANTVSGIDSGL